MNTESSAQCSGFSPALRIGTRSDALNIASDCIRDAGPNVKILEAGCGRKWPFQKAAGHVITGVDLDQHALEMRQRDRRDLDTIVVGDLRHVELPPATFDLIYCSFVLEHVDGAEVVLRNFVSWLKPGGLMILTFPNRDSVYGFFTRITPFWFHVLYKKYVAGNKNAGKPGYDPYPTYHDKVISRPAFLTFSSANRLLVVNELGFWSGRPRFVGVFMKVVGALTFGRLASDHVNLLYVLRKPVS